MNAPMTPGLRAAIAAGQHLKVKDGTNLDPILRGHRGQQQGRRCSAQEH